MALPLIAGAALAVWGFAFARRLARRLSAGWQASREAAVLTDDRLEEWIRHG